MPRKPRQLIIAPNIHYHIVCRGNNQRKIFRKSQDYKKFLRILEDTKKEFPFFLYSYSLLPNHYHLHIESKDISISKIMHYLNTRYSIYFNRRYISTGHLFQDRFYSSVIDKESYFWEVSRYIHLNALRANLIKKLGNYRWDSYPCYAQKEYYGSRKLIDRERFLEFGGSGTLEKRRKAYLKFVEEGIDIKKPPDFIENEKMR